MSVRTLYSHLRAAPVRRVRSRTKPVDFNTYRMCTYPAGAAAIPERPSFGRPRIVIALGRRHPQRCPSGCSRMCRSSARSSWSLPLDRRRIVGRCGGVARGARRRVRRRWVAATGAVSAGADRLVAVRIVVVLCAVAIHTLVVASCAVDDVEYKMDLTVCRYVHRRGARTQYSPIAAPFLRQYM